ncbi:MAG: 30S ribosomal protein S20 [Patescibacteria group bacterium]
MPILKNAKKALRVSKRKAERNQVVKSKMKTMMDKAKKSITVDTISGAFSAIDRAARKHLLHPNKAARLKSQLSKKLAGGDAKPEVAPKAKSKATAKKSTKSKSKKAKK